jgi:hypothetical protein
MIMSATKRERGRRSKLIELGIASRETRGLPVGDVIEPMGFWHKAGISAE